MKTVFVVMKRNPYTNFWSCENVFANEADAEDWAHTEELYSENEYFVEEYPLIASTM